MMAAEITKPGLIERLPTVRGRYNADVPLDKITWFRVGGPAEVMFRPTDVEDLMLFLSIVPPDIDITVIGVGSNLLVRDGGVPGVVIRLGREFAGVKAVGDTLEVGAGALDGNVALAARDAGIAGMEFLSGIPGTIGGGLRMNGGAYGSEFKDILVSARAIDNHGALHQLSPEDMGFTYRSTSVSEDWLFIDAAFKGRPEPVADITRRMAEIKASREQNQPVRSQTGGSTFANPPGAKAWELIDQAGCRGLTRGGAMVSEKHCNFLINTGEATAADLEGLGEEVRRRVFEQSGLTLEWEIRRIGVFEEHGA
ncbi:MAG: UDP-N-acetylmuramate dehydrogenase [Rhodospirillaceae bacterium]|jgi:UDP-N-acetylmuramate dehydrogenase|nr:UDP-N-acetylmuramate dehydrogenase [Rhodospirillaceae bacterium]MBT5245080.1 UDP-N-acetylmuramate dehydrogenase [Rhodospirillaceae bacterium]MBT5562302.1 UDP-N-acetylmuramate dehydrogenase [Rhodospirillaceae bacterium]MBT6242707.1 UDP-N-acetylmuramate dehydrogenase [Rhodospirillaceae bacterium]MBT7137575.1 UDP-N-acetylmuramate dehydrogenase [Rhodospirillaceae bacterium]